MSKSNVQLKYDQLIAEMDSTLWPTPGQAMNNRAASYKALPSLQAMLKNPQDTDPDRLIAAAQSFGTPLEHVLEKFMDSFVSLEAIKNLMIQAKASPVYQGREPQQKTLDTLIERTDKMQKFLFNTVEALEALSLASLGTENTLEK